MISGETTKPGVEPARGLLPRAAGVSLSEGRVPALLFAVAILVRLLFLFVTLNNGGDSFARFSLAQGWLRTPNRLPSDVWPPFHFWLLATALAIWNSEWSARALTMLLGAVTVVPFWGIVRRLFDRQVALYASLTLAVFGFHIGYSDTTSSEVPTVFLLVLGLYCWLRFRNGDGWRWLLAIAPVFGAACLTRFEPWLWLPVLTVLLLDFSSGLRSVLTNRTAWIRAIAFGVASSAGAIGWMIYSFLRWSSPFAQAAQTQLLQETVYAYMRPPLWYRVVVVPGSLVVSLSPLLPALAVLGMVLIFARRRLLPAVPAILLLVLAGAHEANSVRQSLTMSRYTLVYSWLLFPYAFEGVRWLRDKSARLAVPNLHVAVLALFLLWQAGVTAGSYVGPDWSVDRLSMVSPTLPLTREARTIINWLRENRGPNDAILMDTYHDWSTDILRFSGVSLEDAYRVPYPADPVALRNKVTAFLSTRHPRLLVYSPEGELGRILHPSPGSAAELPEYGIRLHRQFQTTNFVVYSIEYR